MVQAADRGGRVCVEATRLARDPRACPNGREAADGRMTVMFGLRDPRDVLAIALAVGLVVAIAALLWWFFAG